MFPESFEAMSIIDLLCFIREQYAVTVKCYSDVIDGGG